MLGALANPAFEALADADAPTTRNDEKAYLIQIINQLDALQPLILAAQQAQLTDKRVTFHYTHYQDNQGQTHNGLLEDTQSIKAGVIQYLNQPTVEPRVVQPLQGDYLDLKSVPNNPTSLAASSAPDSSEVLHADG
ncbi:MAG: hypothetical protein K0S08_656 [Gammaproteobacteria bacterium]|nr:hypothetical protein [Gammaproteobacteria bacterium]